jgi:small-conductance mechanosensitive channel
LRGHVVGATSQRGTPGVTSWAEAFMNGIIYIVGLIVVIMFILSFLGLR